MNMIRTIVCASIFLIPAVGLAHDYHNNNLSTQTSWQNPRHDRDYYYDEPYGYDRDEHRDYREKKRNNKSKGNPKKRHVQSGWDITPQMAKQAPNCYRYTLSTKGGKGSARISSIQGKNYIQVDGTKKGYVCYQGKPTLELGKFANPGVKVTFKLEGKGKYGFYRGEKGSQYKNHWYRSYWGL